MKGSPVPPFTPPRPLVSHTRRLSAIYLPAFCDAAVEPSPAGATVEPYAVVRDVTSRS